MIQVGVIGLGLIGGSLSAALRRSKSRGRPLYHVTGYDRNTAVVRRAQSRGITDAASSRLSDLSRADIIVLCTPVQAMPGVLKKILPSLKKGVVITDVGGVKGDVLKKLSRIVSRRRDITLIGAHPMAGSEKSGIDNANPKIFQGTTCVLSSMSRSKPQALSRVRQMWTSVGSKCLVMTPLEHDQLMAVTSHLPHLLAFALFKSISNVSVKDNRVRSLLAGSFRDMTRIAGSPPDLWHGIFQMNRTALKKAVSGFQSVLSSLLNASPAQLRRRLDQISRTKKRW